MTFAPDLVLHAVTRRLCESLLDDMPHAVMLHGPRGTGLQTLAMHISQTINPAPDGVLVIRAEDDKDISIDQIRTLYHDTRTVRTAGLTVIIDDADSMSLPAQNAFLKLLEEPPRHIGFILTAHSPQHVLPTIHSRVVSVEVRPISRAQSAEMVAEAGIDATTQAQLLFLAHGRPAEIRRLMSDSDYFAAQSTTMRLARTIVQGTLYQRLTLLNTVASDRQRALEVTQTIADIIVFGSRKSLTPQLARQMACLDAAIENITSNANVRLQMLSLALSL